MGFISCSKTGDGFSAITPNQSDLTNINIVAGQITFSEDLGLVTNAVNTGSGNNSVNTVGSNIANVNLVGGSITNVNAVGPSIANVNTVGGAIANVNTVAGINANITTVAGIASDVTAVAGISSAVSAVNSNSTNINAVNSNSANINTVAGANSNITSVAGAITNINTVATNISGVNSFAERYRVLSSAPGSSNDVGDLYFDTTANELKVYKSSGWAAAGSTVNGTSARFKYTASANQTTFTGSDDIYAFFADL